MKAFLIATAIMISGPAMASSRLVCTSLDGSQVLATYSDSDGLTDVQIQTRGGQLQSVPDTHTALIDIPRILEDQKIWKVKSLVIQNRAGSILVVVASGRYIDSGGTSSVKLCEIRN